jgi:hypothetical protein
MTYAHRFASGNSAARPHQGCAAAPGLAQYVVMELLDVRRMAALDMHGAAGTSRRRRLIRAEFFVGAIGGIGLGVWAAATAPSARWQVFGVWVAVPLLLAVLALGQGRTRRGSV